MKLRFPWLLVLGFGLSACRVGGCAANVLGDVVGYTGDSNCDRRSVEDGGGLAPFCQEVVDTVATSQFQDDCRDKHKASTGDGLCPRERIIAGCKLSKVNDDGSDVYDWFYDVTNLEDAGVKFEEPARTKDDVKKLCADPKRYEEGASYVDPP